ncbi:DeoR/GlpR family DNA-binding transcription regulator [Martelella alba]|uniref:DeoR/GlpR transcriptional regulator n=1 Tax=Martelella alba TaxID=2590451 RepID=A0ABY2SLY4_9HYPH|nr:DeoR/GlpR family DNA-binding transcription regulator [Martelella alba]TKI06555.1 DeoR/GlpR transcriptional regulator [Martelella alba]
MNTFERRNKIVDLVNLNGSVSVARLSDSFGTSEVTIRADLRLLEQKGLVSRFHGGASKPATHFTTVPDEAGSPAREKDNAEVLLEDRYPMAEDAKRRIAVASAAMVKTGDTVILDSGSTTLLIARELANVDNITVITNNLPAAQALSDNQDITLVVCGGTLRHKTRSMHGALAELSLQNITADIMFVGADGLDIRQGITTFNEGYAISAVMAKAARRVVAVMDASKFGRRGFNLVLPISDIHCIVTDTGISAEDRQALDELPALATLIV